MNEVYGAMFSGAGFGGSCIGFIKSRNNKKQILKKLEEKYLKKFPDLKGRFKIIFAHHGFNPEIVEI